MGRPDGKAPSSAAPRGVNGLMWVHANHLAPQSTRVNAVLPSAVDTP